MFFYWAPKEKRALFSSLVKDGLKGSGDYGIFGFGAFNGQTANRPELNDELHFVTRLTYPFALKNQIIEPSIQAYTGKFVLAPDQLSANVKTAPGNSYIDERVAASLIMYQNHSVSRQNTILVAVRNTTTKQTRSKCRTCQVVIS